MVTTGNSLERQWREVINHVCKKKISKRVDGFVRNMTGIDGRGDEVPGSYMELLQMRRRNKVIEDGRRARGSKKTRKKRTPSDVQQRYQLAKILVLKVCPLILLSPAMRLKHTSKLVVRALLIALSHWRFAFFSPQVAVQFLNPLQSVPTLKRFLVCKGQAPASIFSKTTSVEHSIRRNFVARLQQLFDKMHMTELMQLQIFPPDTHCGCWILYGEENEVCH